MRIIFDIENHTVVKAKNILKKYDTRYIGIMNCLMETVKVNKLWSKNSLKEFISRMLIVQNIDLNEYFANFKRSEILISLQVSDYNFELKLNDLKNFIGYFTNKDAYFNFEGTQNQFIEKFNIPYSNELNINFSKNINRITNDDLSQINEIVEYISREIDDNLFDNLEINFSDKTKKKFDCMDYDQLFGFYAPNYLSENNYESILKLLLNKEDFENYINDTYEDEFDGFNDIYNETNSLDAKLEVINEIISIGYGTKNGFISKEAILGKVNYHSDPYFEIKYFKFFDDFICESSIGKLLQKWKYNEWEKFLPFSSEFD